MVIGAAPARARTCRWIPRPTDDDGQADVGITVLDDDSGGGPGRTGDPGDPGGDPATAIGRSGRPGSGDPGDPGDGAPAIRSTSPRYYLAYVPRLTVRIPQLQADGSLAGTFLGVAVESWSAQHPGGTPGLVVELTGAAAWTATSGDWSITVDVTGDIPAFVVGPDGLALGPGLTGADASLTVAASKHPPSGGGPAFILGSPTGTRFELGAVKAGLAVHRWTRPVSTSRSPWRHRPASSSSRPATPTDSSRWSFRPTA